MKHIKAGLIPLLPSGRRRLPDAEDSQPVCARCRCGYVMVLRVLFGCVCRMEGVTVAANPCHRV